MRLRWVAVLVIAALAALAGAARAEAPPALLAEPVYQPPRPVHRTLPNGARVLVVERHDLPLVTVQIAMAGAGSAADPPGKAGLAAFTTDLLDEGAGGLDSMALAERMERLGASLHMWTEQDVAYVRVSCLRRNLPAALEILGPIVTAPALGEKDAARVREDRVTAIRLRRDEPGTVSAIMLDAALFGRDAPYGHPSLGYAPDLEKLGAADARAFYAAHWGPERMTLIVAGDVTADETQELLNARLGAWRPEGTRAPLDSAAVRAPAPRQRLLVVDRSGTEQSDLRFGVLAIARTDPRAFAADVLVNLLGGAFTGRLNLRLREELGWTYGVSVQTSYLRRAAVIGVSTAVAQPKTAESVKEVLRMLGELGRKDVTAEELRRTQLDLVQGMPRWFANNEDVADAFAGLVLVGLPDDWFEHYREAILKVTAADVRRAAKEVFAPERLVLVVVGDLKAVGDLGKVGAGPEARYDPDGEPVKSK